MGLNAGANISIKSVQFRHPEHVMKAWENRGVVPWAIWQGKQFQFKYDGQDSQEAQSLLAETLDMLCKSRSAAIYTLAVYELKKGQKINSSTPFDGSFNFRFEDHIHFQDAMGIAQSNPVLNEFMKRMEMMQQQINQLHEYLEQQGQNEPAEIGQVTTADKLLGMLEPVMPVLAEKLIGKLFPEDKPPLPSPTANQEPLKKVI